MTKKNNKFNTNTISNLMGGAFNTGKKESQQSPVKKQSNDKNETQKKSPKQSNNKVNNSHKNTTKKHVVENRYGVLPMSCTLDIRTIGKLEAAKQVLGAHNRDAVVEALIKTPLNKLLQSKGNKGKQDYKLYYKVFMMKHKKSAEKHYKQFYQNGREK